jgi:hypothetical protein
MSRVSMEFRLIQDFRCLRGFDNFDFRFRQATKFLNQGVNLAIVPMAAVAVKILVGGGATSCGSFEFAPKHP